MSEEIKNENLENNQEVLEKNDKIVEGQEPTDSVKKVEQLEDITEDELVEQLSVIKEVRDELANAYKASKANQKAMEQLQSEIESLRIGKNNTIKTIESLSSKLEVYKTRDVEADKIA